MRKYIVIQTVIVNLVVFFVLIFILAFSCEKNKSGIGKSENPHYLSYNVEPFLLIITDHHYGAIIDLDFDLEKYLNFLSVNGMNMTRVNTEGIFILDGNGSPFGPQVLLLLNES